IVFLLYKIKRRTFTKYKANVFIHLERFSLRECPQVVQRSRTPKNQIDQGDTEAWHFCASSYKMDMISIFMMKS
ncbi:hypothetical protein D0Y65_030854, partial [Glycine soja]